MKPVDRDLSYVSRPRHPSVPELETVTTVGEKISSAVRHASAGGNAAGFAAALHCVEARDLAPYFRAELSGEVTSAPLAQGVGASPGAASGVIAVSAEGALRVVAEGGRPILVRPMAAADDVVGMQVSSGIVVSRGDTASHAAIVARQCGIPAIVGAAAVHIHGDIVEVGDAALTVGDEITIDGSTGKIYAGALPAKALTPLPNSSPCSRGRTRSAREESRFESMRKPPSRSNAAWHSAPAASAFAGPSICSLPQTGSHSCAASSWRTPRNKAIQIWMTSEERMQQILKLCSMRSGSVRQLSDSLTRR